MNLPRYDYDSSDDFLDYEFYSDGPKGLIRKVVRFSYVDLPEVGLEYFNLGFGDWSAERVRIDDFVVSNNEDADKVLATVAFTVMDFTDNYPGFLVYAEGSTPVRTRKYQMGINRHLAEISEIFDVYGLVENKGFVPFQPGINFKAFLIKRKV